MSEPSVIIRGKVFLYKQKAPFVPSGKSVLGALEYDQDRDKVRCHECGRWFRSVAQHIFSAHGISADGYKSAHGLQRNTALVCERTRSAHIKNAAKSENLSRGGFQADAVLARKSKRSVRSMERRNLSGTCPAQLLQKIVQVAHRIGRTPSISELSSYGVSAASALRLFRVSSVGDVMALAGLQPNATGRECYSREVLIEMLRDHWVEFKRLPARSDYRRGLLPSRGQFLRVFGGMREAYVAAGIAGGIR